MTAFANLRASAAFAALTAASARLGRDPAQVQAAGGNSSLKSGGAMWVKASGFWLAKAEARDIFLPVDVAGLRAALEAGEDLDAMAFVPADANPAGLRPSIETTLHATLDWPVVLHTHCVATIATAVRADAEAVLAERLAGLDPVFVPYAMPGPSLARAILARAGARARVVVLGNHGLVVGGADVATAEALLREVSARLGNAIGGSGSGHADPAPDPDLMARLEGSGWSPARHPAVHALARDPARCAIVDSGSLYPDHVIFLGPGVVVLRAGETPDAAAARLGGMSKLLLLPGQGAALRSDATAAQHAMARCLGDVAAQVAPGTVLTRLSPADEAALLNWDAEKYRQALEAAREAGK